MSVEWGKPKAPAGDKPPAAAPAPPPQWEQLAAAFPAWTLEPPFSVALRKKPAK